MNNSLSWIAKFIITCIIGGLLGWSISALHEKIMYPAVKK